MKILVLLGFSFAWVIHVDFMGPGAHPWWAVWIMPVGICLALLNARFAALTTAGAIFAAWVVWAVMLTTHVYDSFALYAEAIYMDMSLLLAVLVLIWALKGEKTA